MFFLKILAGAAVLLFGRRLFWLFVGVVGFVFGAEFAALFLQAAPQLVVFAVAAMAGLIGVVLAYFLQEVVIAAVGFLVGGSIAMAFATAVFAASPYLAWLPFLIGGVIGALLVLLIFDWALILLSSLFGARLLVEVLALSRAETAIAFAVLFAVGAIFQAAAYAWRSAA